MEYIRAYVAKRNVSYLSGLLVSFELKTFTSGLYKDITYKTMSNRWCFLRVFIEVRTQGSNQAVRRLLDEHARLHRTLWATVCYRFGS